LLGHDANGSPPNFWSCTFYSSVASGTISASSICCGVPGR
jgi:hypothetical protein